jgi:type I restriction enzyme R subunit
VAGRAVVSTSNFGFLGGYDAQLAQLGALAERYFHDDPGTAILKLRQFVELLSKTVSSSGTRLAVLTSAPSLSRADSFPLS